MARSLKAAELFLSVGLATALFTGCAASERGSEVTADNTPVAAAEGGEGGEGDEGGGEETSKSLNWANKFDDSAVISEFTSKVVIPNYEQFSDKATALNTAVEAFVAAPSEGSLKAARDAWSAIRLSWEQTETFAFGPAGSLGLDGAMDSWPVNQTDIEKILAGDEPLTPDSVAQLQDTERGMHAIEFILFGTEANKALSEFSDREKQYLAALTQDLDTSAAAMLASWQKGVEGQPAYETVFAKAGDASNTVYPTAAAAAQELVTGIIDSLTEVGEEKLEAPFKAQSAEGLESRFSAQTMNDLKSNLQSAENGYLGEFAEGNSKAEASVSTFVAARDPELDKKVKAEFEAAHSALDAVPTPLEKSLTDPAAKADIEGAIAAILAVKDTLVNEVVPLI